MAYWTCIHVTLDFITLKDLKLRFFFPIFFFLFFKYIKWQIFIETGLYNASITLHEEAG